MRPRKAPMEAGEATHIIKTMRRETPRSAMIKVMRAAVKIGNLTDEAKDIYRAELCQMETENTK